MSFFKLGPIFLLRRDWWIFVWFLQAYFRCKVREVPLLWLTGCMEGLSVMCQPGQNGSSASDGVERKKWKFESMKDARKVGKPHSTTEGNEKTMQQLLTCTSTLLSTLPECQTCPIQLVFFLRPFQRAVEFILCTCIIAGECPHVPPSLPIDQFRWSAFHLSRLLVTPFRTFHCPSNQVAKQQQGLRETKLGGES